MPGLNANTKLLKHANGYDTSISYPITFNGTTQLDTAQSKFGGSSLLLDGSSSSYLSVPDSSDWNFGSGTFTIDLWARWNSVSNTSFVSQGQNGTNYWFFTAEGTELLFQTYVGGTYGILFRCDFIISVDTWYHLALVRVNTDDASTAWRIFINGVSQTLTKSQGSWNATMPNLAINLDIGGSSLYSYTIDGWIDEVRFSKGISRWSSNFTPSISPYEADTDTTLLLHLDGADTATSTNDESGGDVSFNRHIITYHGTTQLDTAQSKFGGSSVIFDGADPDYLSISDSDDWNFGSGDFTIDFWAKLDSTDTGTQGMWYAQQVDGIFDGDDFTTWSMGSDGAMRFISRESGTTLANYTSSAWTNDDDWHHMALVRSGSNIYMFRDGISLSLTEVTAISTNTLSNFSAEVNLGRVKYNDSVWLNTHGWIDEVRITKGVAVWTSNFTPPTVEYSLDKVGYNQAIFVE